MLDAIKHITDDNFFFQENSASQCNCCGALDSFLLNHAPNMTELNALITRFRESYSSVSMSRESKSLKKSSSDRLHCGNALIQHLSEKCDFLVIPLCQIVQKHKLFAVAQ